MRRKPKFHVGQVVYYKAEMEYLRITGVNFDYGDIYYDVAWKVDKCYDYVDENALRKLHKREKE